MMATAAAVNLDDEIKKTQKVTTLRKYNKKEEPKLKNKAAGEGTSTEVLTSEHDRFEAIKNKAEIDMVMTRKNKTAEKKMAATAP